MLCLQLSMVNFKTSCKGHLHFFFIFAKHCMIPFFNEVKPLCCKFTIIKILFVYLLLWFCDDKNECTEYSQTDVIKGQWNIRNIAFHFPVLKLLRRTPKRLNRFSIRQQQIPRIVWIIQYTKELKTCFILEVLFPWFSVSISSHRVRQSTWVY